MVAQNEQQIDLRNIQTGHRIPKENYCDQPYIVTTEDGNWLCVMTTGQGKEGQVGQHIVSTISTDQGKTWTELVDIEPANGPEASWGTPLIVPGGRVYAFYTYNTANRREVAFGEGQVTRRVDTLGDFVFKYSDDHGRSWSEQRHVIPVRPFDLDINNPYRGEVLFFWSVCKPIIHDKAVYIGLGKVGKFGEGFMETSEGAFVRCENILYEEDPAKLQWETLPEGTVGLRAPASKVADEHNLVGMNDGSLYCVYRTTEGHNCHAYSRDNGRTWTPPEHAVYSPGGRKIKHPRAFNFVKKFSNGKYLMWFHNNGLNLSKTPKLAYWDRNPVWLSGGIEKDGFIHWSNPEIVLYDDEPDTRISYPDMVETKDGRFFLSETQKTIANIHEIDRTLLEGLWEQDTIRARAEHGILLHIEKEEIERNQLYGPLELPNIQTGGGFSVEMAFQLNDVAPGQMLVDARTPNGIGWTLTLTNSVTIQMTLNDGRTQSSWDCDQNLIQAGKTHHIVVIVDGGPKIISFVVDGQLCDGSAYRQFGFGRMNPQLRSVGGGQLKLGPYWNGSIDLCCVYDRYLRTSEAIGNFRSYMDGRGGFLS